MRGKPSVVRRADRVAEALRQPPSPDVISPPLPTQSWTNWRCWPTNAAAAGGAPAWTAEVLAETERPGGGAVKLRGRLDRLERPLPGRRMPGWARVLAERVAVEQGLDPGEVVREAEALLARVTAVGMVGDAEGLAVFLAAEDGLDQSDVQAEVERMMGAGDEGRARQRLARLGPRLLPPTGCPACQGWQPDVLVWDDGPHRPEGCLQYGSLVPTRTVVWDVGVRAAKL